MKTKILLFTLALACFIRCPMAAAYTNVAVTIGRDFNLLSNPLDNQRGNLLSDLLPTAGMDAMVYLWIQETGAYEVYYFDFDFGWFPDNASIPPGKGFWLRDPYGSSSYVLFGGSPPQATGPLAAGPGFVLVGPRGTSATDFQGLMGFAPPARALVYEYAPDGASNSPALDPDNPAFNRYAFDGVVWHPHAPVFQPGRGYFINTNLALPGISDPQRDFGDAPAPYPTTLAQNGARHILAGGLFLGSDVDSEADGQPDPDALGDDRAGRADEDGVLFTDELLIGQEVAVTVSASKAGKLDAWIDYNQNGSWNDEGEQIFQSAPVAAGQNVLTFIIPVDNVVTNPTYARFRLSSTGGLKPTGEAADGEVEDYKIAIGPQPPGWEDIFPPTWERGLEGTTTQAWELNYPGCSILRNPFGNSNMNAVKNVVFHRTWEGRAHVWELLPADPVRNVAAGQLEATIRNFPSKDPKELRLQVTYRGDEPQYEVYDPDNQAKFRRIGPRLKSPAARGWTHELTMWTLDYCPTNETVIIRAPAEGAVFVDQVTIDTVCRPVITALAYKEQPQAPNLESSTLIDVDGKKIMDREFARWARVALVDAVGEPQVYNATFMFQQCFGGGFLDDLDRDLTGAGVIWAGGSASQHDETAFGQIPGPAPVPAPAFPAGANWNIFYVPPMPGPLRSLWTIPFSVHLNANVPMGPILQQVRINDEIGFVAGPNFNGFPRIPTGWIENSQVLYRNRGDWLQLLEPSARGKKWAILFAGFTDSPRFFFNVLQMWNTLENEWINVPHEVVVLFGDGMNQVRFKPGSGKIPMGWKKATAANLKQELLNVAQAIGPADQFVFYSSDHGGNTMRGAAGGGGAGGIVPGAGGLPGQPMLPTTMPISPGMQRGMQRQSDNLPTLSIDYHGLTGPATVLWNGMPIGTLEAGQTNMEFSLDESNIGTNNLVQFVNPNEAPFTVEQTVFFTGAISDDPPMAEAVVQSPALLPDGNARLRLQGEPGRAYVLEATTNMRDWVPLQTNLMTGYHMDVTDLQQATEGMRVYRTRMLGSSTTGAPIIVTEAESQMIASNAPTGLGVTALGALPMSYQWRFNGMELPGQTNSTLWLDHVSAGDTGQYDVVVRNAHGMAVSHGCTVSVQP